MRMILLRHALRRTAPLQLPPLRRPILAQRCLSTPPPASAEPDWVRSAIQKMMMEQQAQENAAAGERVDLEKALLSLQNQLREAESCVQDCRDADVGARPLELATADAAIDRAVQRLLDVLEGSRGGCQNTQEWVQRIKDLRAQVKALQVSTAAVETDDVPRTEPHSTPSV